MFASWREELGWHLLDWLLEHCPVQRGGAGMLWAMAVTPCDKRKPLSVQRRHMLLSPHALPWSAWLSRVGYGAEDWRPEAEKERNLLRLLPA